MTQHSNPRRRSAWQAALLALGLVAIPVAAGAQTYYVNNGSASCSDTGPGTLAQPYCTITAAVNARKGPGITILVKPGVYREQVTVPGSGSAGSPYVIRADGGAVVIDGSDDLSSAATWTLVSGNVWLASSVNWLPQQVFSDGVRLDASTSAPTSMPARSYQYVAGTGLYVNVGGGNPGLHTLLVSRRNYGIRIDRRSFVTIEGFTVVRQNDRSVYLTGPLNNTIVTGNSVSFAQRYGIAAVTCSLLTVSNNTVWDNGDHGIYLQSVTQSTIEQNESYRNARASTRAANGIYLITSSFNLIRRNRCHHNQDTGLHFQTCNDNTCVQNLLYGNGDHGTDHLLTTRTVHIGETVSGNFKDGFSFEGNSPGNTVLNSIAVNNGLTTNEFDLWVDAGSSSGFVSDYNVFWNSTSQTPVKFGNTTYASVSTYSSITGLDGQSVQADPLFADTTAGDFHLRSGSSAIDNANSSVSGWPSTDFDGRGRFDDPAVPNNGTGPVAFADRGALEFFRALAPVAVLGVTPSSGAAPLAVTASAAGSSDPDGTIASYTFDFGDGTVVGPQASSSATHTFAGGTWTVLLTVRDNQGLADTATAIVSSLGNQAPNAALSVTPSSGAAPLAVTASGAASSDPENGVLSYEFNFGDGTVVGPRRENTHRKRGTYLAGAGVPRRRSAA